MNNEVNEVSNDLIIIFLKCCIVINFIILSTKTQKTFVKNVEKRVGWPKKR